MSRGPDTRSAATNALLDLVAGTTRGEIDRAFRNAALRHHPDVGGDPSTFRALVEARGALIEQAAQTAPAPPKTANPVVVVPRRRWRDLFAEILDMLRPPRNSRPRVH